MFLNKHTLLKNRKTKISHIFGADRDISKIRKVLSSAYKEEEAIEFSQKSANFLFFVVKGLTSSSMLSSSD